MNRTIGDLRTKGIIFNLGDEKFILRKATEEEISAHQKPEDQDQVAMHIENDELTVTAHHVGD